MATAWPVTLQQLVNQDSFSFEIGETVIRTDMDIGPSKVRRRVTRSVDKATISIWVNAAEYTILYDFFDITLNGGVEPFTLDHPITGVATDFRFLSPPRFSPVGGETFNVSMSVEILP